MKIRLIAALTLCVVIYLGSYVAFRQSNIEVWEKDNNEYVIYPADSVYFYYLFRPMSYLDAKMTGMRSHIGPH